MKLLIDEPLFLQIRSSYNSRSDAVPFNGLHT